MIIIILYILLQLIHIYCIRDLKRSNEIVDIGHNLLPALPSKFKFFPDLICGLLFVVSLYLHRDHYSPLMWTLIVVFVLRTITIQLTVLPPVKSFDCTNRHAIDCTQDYIFSGHFSKTVVCILFILAAKPTLVVPMVSIGLVQAFFIIGLRNHYTIDVFIGALVAYFVFSQQKLRT